MIRASGAKNTRLYGKTSRKRSEPRVRICSGTPVDEVTVAICQALARPRTTRLTPRVMISGWTRKTPTQTPLSSPAASAAASAMPTPSSEPPGWARKVAERKPANEATPRQLQEAPEHDDPDQDRTLGDDREVRVHVEERHVASDQLQDQHGDDRAEDSAAAASEADAAENDRRDAGQRVRPRDRGSDAGARGEAEPRERGEEAGQRVRGDLGAPDAHPAPERGEPIAADRVDRQAEA